MDPYFMALFPIVTVLFIAADWPRLKNSPAGVKLAYSVLITLALGLFVSRSAGIQTPMPPRFFVQYISPAIESMLGIK